MKLQRKAKAVFLDLLDHPPLRHGTVLDARCGTDAKLRQLVETLLRDHTAASGFLEEPTVRMRDSAAIDMSPPTARFAKKH